MDGGEKEPPDPDGVMDSDFSPDLEFGSCPSSPRAAISSPAPIDIIPVGFGHIRRKRVATKIATTELATKKKVMVGKNFDQSLTSPLCQEDNITDLGASTQESSGKILSPPLRQAYYSTDLGPFIVHIARVTDNPATATIHPIRVGKMLFDLQIPCIKNGGVKKLGRNRISVEFESFQGANDFIMETKFEGYSKSIPSYHVTRMGIVRGIPIDYSNDDIVESVRVCNAGKVLKARRLNFKSKNKDGNSEWLPSETVVLTFDGQKTPDRVYCYHNSLPVEPYKFPVIQCFKCCRYGHIKTQCRSEARCFKCAQPHLGESCTVDQISCLFCSGLHSAIDKRCPEQNRQHSIKRLMSDEAISFQEASKRFPFSRKSFVEVASKPKPQPVSKLQAQSSQSPSLGKTSYVKTVYRTPKPRSAVIQTGYDARAHREILNDFTVPSPKDGCALQSHCRSRVSPPDSVENALNMLMSFLSASQPSASLPPHVAELFSQVAFVFSQKFSPVQYGSNTPVEY